MNLKSTFFHIVVLLNIHIIITVMNYTICLINGFRKVRQRPSKGIWEDINTMLIQ